MTDLPYLDHIDQSEFQYIYEPSDDTFLLMDTLYSDLPQIMASSPSICLEIGSGSGCVSAVLSREMINYKCNNKNNAGKEDHNDHNKREGSTSFPISRPLLATSSTAANNSNNNGGIQTNENSCGRNQDDNEKKEKKMMKQRNNNCIFFATDINPRATLATKQTGLHNSVGVIDVIRTDLVSSLSHQLAFKVDILLFNPPYVPTPEEEIGGDGISAAWAGGKDGRVVIDRFLPMVKDLLAPHKGRLYLVLVKENRPAEIASYFQNQGMTAQIINSRKARNERLSIMLVTNQ